MERCHFTTPDTSIPMRAFFVYRISQTFGNNAPLKRKVFVVVERSTLVGTPAHRTMIDNHIFTFIGLEGVVLNLVLIAHPESQKPDYNIVGTYKNRKTFDTNPITGCRLSCDCDIILCNFQF